MPAPTSAFAAICVSIAGIDPGEVRAVEDFFLKEFSTLDQTVRETSFYWALSLDQEPAEDDREALDTLLAAVGFRSRRRKALDEGRDGDDLGGLLQVSLTKAVNAS